MAGLLLTEVEQTEQSWRRLALAVLRARQASTEDWHRRLWSGLESIVGVLDDIGVEVAVAKGIAAEARWYSRLGERPCNDLDLLIGPGDVDRIDDIIAAIEPAHPLCGKTRRLAERGFLASIDLEHDGVPIDLHWDIFKLGISSRNRDAIWERTVPFPLPNNTTTRALDPETSFVHFLVHLNKDRFRRLIGFVDAARIYERETLDIDAVNRMIRADGLEASVNSTWNVVVRTLRIDAPSCRVSPGLRALTWHVAWRSSIRLRGTESRMRFRHREHLIALLVPGRSTEAIRSWLRRRFPPAELLAYMYSAYGSRWSPVVVSTEPHSRLWVVTVGRVKAWRARRRLSTKATNTSSRRSDRRRLARLPGRNRRAGPR